MKTKRRPEFIAWENVQKSQIAASENSIKCLMDEVEATRALLEMQKRTLAKAQQDEADYEAAKQ